MSTPVTKNMVITMDTGKRIIVPFNQELVDAIRSRTQASNSGTVEITDETNGSTIVVFPKHVSYIEY
ncbi:hypothetical protein HNR42_000879 [Deinobacterium chartae]|uniref:Uncharacterized protein n=1 Tax=Deinobacterium chartae TaxID=521158 RepID=A0A841I011_9DEIO|nr:hypothetical protein [Deinobacterium chartae]MBB6097462.1 hypothetical protein [Deinobacterium chartae]